MENNDPRYSDEAIATRTDYHPPENEADVGAHQRVRLSVRQTMLMFAQVVPDGVEKEVAFRRLDEAMMHAHAGLAMERARR